MDGRLASIVDISLIKSKPSDSIGVVQGFVFDDSAFESHVSRVSARGQFELGTSRLGTSIRQSLSNY